MSGKTPPSIKNPAITNIILNDSTDNGPPETPRSHRSNGGNAPITQLRPVIAIEMDREFVLVPLQSFVKEYLPFVPSDEVIDKVVHHLLCERHPPSTAAGAETGQEFTDDAVSDNDSPDEEICEDDELLRSSLRTGRSLMLRHKDRVMFRSFPRPPSQANGTEKNVFAPLSDISSQISQIPDLVPGRQRNQYHYRDVSSKTIQSNINGSNNKIDACFMRGQSASQPATHDIAVVIEQKPSLDHRSGNNRQAVSANVQIMNDDVRRTFTYGITIESDKVTLWYHSRSHSAISEQFSFVEQPELLLEIFTSFLFATPEELGYDPLVEYLGKGQYVFHGIPSSQNASEVDTYKTLTTISELRANNITGRMARIFTAVKFLPKSKRYGTKKYVLKDVWLDNQTQTERQLQDAIFRDIEHFWSPESKDTVPALEPLKKRHHKLVTSNEYRRHFLTIEGDYDGPPCKPIASNFKPVRNVLAGPPLEDENREREALASRTATNASKTNHSIPENATLAYKDFSREDFERTYVIKRRYRVVYSELCRTVGDLTTLGQAFDVLHQCLTPLELLLCAGWVHRDISAGNIMAYRKNLDDDNQPWRVILADLEYAKKFPPGEDYSPSLDPKTGTPYFMPVEIMMRMTLFSGSVYQELVASSTNKSSAGDGAGINEPLSSVSQEEDIYLRAQRKRQAAREKKEQEKKVQRPKGVVHNFQHDLESIWWLVLWFITSRTGDKPAQEYSRQIFQNTIRFVPERWQAVISEIEEELRKCLGPLGDHFAEQVEDLRSAMLLTYIERVRDDKIKEISSYVPISQAFRTFFQDIEKTKDIWANIPLIAQNRYIDPAERKRPRPDDDEDFPGLIDDGAEPKMKLPKA